MALTKTQQRILYSLGLCHQKLNEPYHNKPVDVYFSKIAFINLIKQADFVKKQDRAIYKNLEILEKKKLLAYPERKIQLTQKGQRFFNKIDKEIRPFLNLKEFWNQNLKKEKKIQSFINTKKEVPDEKT